MKKHITANGLVFEPFIGRDEIAQRVQGIGQAITEKYAGQNPLFIGVLNGSFMFLSDLLKNCDLSCEVAFVRLSSYKGTRSTGKIETVYGLEMSVEQRHLIVVEDIVDSGRTLHFFLDYLRQQNPLSVALASLLFKPEALLFPVELDYVGFRIPEKFVVGYGLDYDGLCRNLPDIYQVVGE